MGKDKAGVSSTSSFRGRSVQDVFRGRKVRDNQFVPQYRQRQVSRLRGKEDDEAVLAETKNKANQIVNNLAIRQGTPLGNRNRSASMKMSMRV